MAARDSSSPLEADSLTDLAAAVAPVELGADQRASMRERIVRRIRARPPAGTTTLRAYEGEWITIAPGVTRKLLREDRGAERMSYLIRMDPGVTAPCHPHTQVEECLVLEGEVLVGEQRIGVGDWHVAEPGSSHDDFRTVTGCLLFIQSEVHAGQ
jgi:anti-sigma factor ChrR (cupin superfamily)